MGEKIKYDQNKKPIIKAPLDTEDFRINNVQLEKVDRFKYLEFWLLANDSNMEHLEKRKNMAWATASDIAKIGFNNPYMIWELKGKLYESFIRPKLSYGLENARLNTNDIRELETVEVKILKRACGLPYRSYTAPILAAMGIKRLSRTIEKRKISLLKQLMENPLTRKIILKGNEEISMEDVFAKINVSMESL